MYAVNISIDVPVLDTYRPPNPLLQQANAQVKVHLLRNAYIAR